MEDRSSLEFVVPDLSELKSLYGAVRNVSRAVLVSLNIILYKWTNSDLRNNRGSL